MSAFDSQSTTPTRTSLDNHSHQYDHNEQYKRLETIPSVLPDADGRGKNYDEHDERNPTSSRRSSGTRTEDIEKEAALEAGLNSSKEEESEAKNAAAKDPNLVEWDGPDDPENPQNFSTAKKWVITMLLSSLTIWITFSSSVFSQATQVTASLFGVSDEVMILATSLPLFVSLICPNYRLETALLI